MKILCVSDYKDPLVYSSNVKSRYSGVNLVLGAGDLDLDYYGFIVSSLNKPLLFIFGNHNLARIGEYKREFSGYNDELKYEREINKPTYGATYIGGKVVTIGGVIFAGLGGTKRYNRGINQYSEFGMFCSILKLLPKLIFNKIFHGRYLDILLTHAPPEGIHDKDDPCHKGFKIFLWFMRVFKPKYLIHGHVHLYNINDNRKTIYHDTVVINAYGHIVIDTEEHI